MLSEQMAEFGNYGCCTILPSRGQHGQCAHAAFCRCTSILLFVQQVFGMQVFWLSLQTSCQFCLVWLNRCKNDFLQDILENPDLHIDDMFIASLVSDLIKVSRTDGSLNSMVKRAKLNCRAAALCILQCYVGDISRQWEQIVRWKLLDR